MSKTGWIILGSVGAVVAIIVLTLFGSYVSAHNTAVGYETTIKAKWNDNKQILGQYHLRISEMAQIPSMYKDDFREVIEASMSGRYGKDGSQATFQWLKEHGIQIDTKMYTNIQQEIAAGRVKFEKNQSTLLDQKRGYERQLGLFWRGLWMRIAGFPKVDLDSYNVVTSSKSEAAFEEGVEQPMKLRE